MITPQSVRIDDTNYRQLADRLCTHHLAGRRELAGGIVEEEVSDACPAPQKVTRQDQNGRKSGAKSESNRTDAGVPGADPAEHALLGEAGVAADVGMPVLAHAGGERASLGQRRGAGTVAGWRLEPEQQPARSGASRR